MSKGDGAESGSERLWRPRGGSGDDFAFSSGFLVPWSSAWDGALANHLVRLRDLSDVPLSILLGEPGAGKSTELSGTAGPPPTPGAAAAAPELRLSVDLSELSTRQDVLDAVFAGAVWDRWRAEPQALLRLDIDSTDECHVDLPTVFKVLLSGLRAVEDRGRLRLRLVCRTGVWPVGLEPSFQDLFGGANVRVLDIAPLTQEAARAIAAESGVTDLDGFFAAVEHRGVEALAARPVALKLLCSLFRRDGELPSTLEALFRRGCEALAEETNASRLSANKTGKLGAMERMAIAARLAAVMVFTATDHVWVGPDLGDRPRGDLLPRDVAGGDEPTGQGSVPVSEEAVREVVTSTGLFTGAGANRFAWAHRTFAEFLAAWFVRAWKLTSAQVRQLLMHPHQRGRVVPQLSHVAAWVASFEPEFFRHVASSDPAVLLGSDVQNAATADRRSLVDGILTEAAAKAIDDSDLNWRRGYRRLAHVGLDEQLRPWIVNRAGHYLVRRISIDIAEACNVRTLVGALIDVALDESDQPHVRDQAAHAVVAMGDPSERGRLRPLLDDPENSDADDQLKGSALRATWPGALSADELFSKLTPPKEELFHGAYAAFLMFDLPKSLTDADLAAGLRWAARTIRSSRRHEIAPAVHRLVDTVVARGLRAAPSAPLDAALADFLWAAADEHDQLAGGDEESAAEVARAAADLAGAKRDAVLTAIVALVAARPAEDDVVRLTFLTPPVLRGGDIGWCFQRLGSETDPAKRKALVKLGVALFRRANYHPLDPFLDAAAAHAELADALPEMQPMPVAGPVADAARGQLETVRKLQRRSALASQAEPDTATWTERVIEKLAVVERRDPDAWQAVVEALVVGQRGRSRTGSAASTEDLTGTRGWESCDEATRGRILGAAETFLRARGEDADQWFDHCGGYPADVAGGLQALTVLLLAGPERLAGLPVGAWMRWMGTLLGYPAFETGGKLAPTRVELLKRAHAAAPDEVRAWLERLFDREARQREPRTSRRSRRRSGTTRLARPSCGGRVAPGFPPRSSGTS